MSAFLEPSWGHLELLKASWPILGAFGGHLGGILGLSWTILWPSCAILAFFGGAFCFVKYGIFGTSHETLIVRCRCRCLFDLFRTTFDYLAHDGHFWGHLGAILGPFGVSWEPSWGHRGLLGAILGPSWGYLGPPWGWFGSVIHEVSGNLPSKLDILCCCCRCVGLCWAILGPS